MYVGLNNCGHVSGISVLSSPMSLTRAQSAMTSRGQMINGQIIDRDDLALDLGFLGGAEGIRTPDPLDANEVRYQAALQPPNRRQR
jgi:hypothetical protein